MVACKGKLLFFIIVLVLTLYGRSTILGPTSDIRMTISSAQPGDTLLLSDGDYQSPGWLDNKKFMPPVLIKSVNDKKARIVQGNGVNINNCRGLIFDGLEITALATNSGLIQIQGQSSYITIINCHIHHAPLDADCIKVNQSNNISIIGCQLNDPGARAAGNGQQETLDYLDVDTGLIRGCFFTGGTSRQYINAKGLSSFITVENCILKDHNGDQGDAAIILGGWSSESFFAGHPAGYECENMVVRNNIILNSRTGAFQVSNVKNGYIYNNFVWNCKSYNAYRGLINVSPGNGPGANKGTVHLEICNNIFASNAATGAPTQFFTLSSTTLDSFTHRNNLYYFNGAAIPTGGYFNPNTEEHAVFENPGFEAARGDSYDAILSSLLPAGRGPWVGAGVSVLQEPFSAVTTDIVSISRINQIFDIGPFVFRTTTVYNQDLAYRQQPLQVHSNTTNPAFLLNGRFVGTRKKVQSRSIIAVLSGDDSRPNRSCFSMIDR